MASIQTNLTPSQIIAQLDVLRAGLGGPVEVRDSSGKSVRYNTVSDTMAAIAALEDLLRNVQGGNDSRTTYAQHRRGDGPSGPCNSWINSDCD